MAGIIGTYSDDSSYGKEDIKKILKPIRHRGEQNKNIFSDGGILLGYQSDNQEHTNKHLNGNHCYVDGLIYNKKEILERLQGSNKNIN